MTTTNAQNTASSVPNFLEDDEDEGGVALQPGVSQQSDNSAERVQRDGEVPSIGADRTPAVAISGNREAPKADDFNPVLDTAREEFDGEDDESMLARPAAPSGREWKERVAAGEVKGYEHPNRGANPASPTKKKASTYRRKRLGEKDFTVLGVLLIHEFLTTKQVGIIRGIAPTSARRLMLGLQELGVVGQENFPYGPQLWYLTGKGLTTLKGAMEISEYAQPLHRKGHFDLSKIRPNLLAAQVSAQLIAGTDTIRQFIDIPLSTGIDLLPYLIPESYIRSEFTKAIQRTAGKGVFADKQKRAFAIQNHWHKLRESAGEGNVLSLREHPEAWMTVGRSVIHRGAGKHFHPADLVLNLLSYNGRPVHIEIETSMKNEAEIRKIITTYMDPNTPNASGPVIYLTHEKSIAKRVGEIAQEVFEQITQMRGKPKDQWSRQDLIKVAVLHDAEGNLFSGNVWDL